MEKPARPRSVRPQERSAMAKTEIVTQSHRSVAEGRPEDARNWVERFEAEEPQGPSLRVPMIAGLVTIIGGMGGLAGWAFAAHLDSAAIANATVIVDSKR